MIYRKRPVDIQAVQWTGRNFREVYEFAGEEFRAIQVVTKGDDITAEVYDKLHSTWVGLRDGDWVLQGVRGEFYPCEGSVFAETYELVEAS